MRVNVPPSKLLIPMAFVSLLGVKMTLIGKLWPKLNWGNVVIFILVVIFLPII